jgi:hypothetical protein
MVQLFKQFIYCNPQSNHNYPNAIIDKDALTSGSIFNEYVPITQLGIQGPPGTKFYINHNDLPVIIGFTGLFELNFTEGGSINHLRFDGDSIDRVDSSNLILIVDIAYMGGGE